MAKKIVNSKDIRDSTREKIYTRETIRKAMKRIVRKKIYCRMTLKENLHLFMGIDFGLG